MAREQRLAMTGNVVTVELDGRTVGICQSLNVTDNYALEPVSGIGNIKCVEYVPTRAQHSLRVSQVMLYKGALTDLGNQAAGSTAAIGQFINNGDAILRGTIFDIAVRAIPVTGVPVQGSGVTPDPNNQIARLIRKYLSCSFEEGSIEVTKHQILVFNCSFRALDVTFNDSNPVSVSGIQALPLGLGLPTS